jgi:hypothetical protein
MRILKILAIIALLVSILLLIITFFRYLDYSVSMQHEVKDAKAVYGAIPNILHRENEIYRLLMYFKIVIICNLALVIISILILNRSKHMKNIS